MKFKVLQKIQIVLLFVFLILHFLLHTFNFHPELLLTITFGMTFLEMIAHHFFSSVALC